MKKEDVKYGAYVQILKEELVPAMGCTEPIALAYAAAKAREVLGEKPDKVRIGASGSIIKNVKSVIVPNTDHLKGIPAAAAAGIIAGRPEKELEVIADVSMTEIEEMKDFLQNTEITVEYVDNGITFDIIVTESKGESSATVRIANYHTNIVLIEKNGKILMEETVEGEKEEGLTDRSLLNMKDILDFARTVDVEDVKEVIGRQIAYNTAIAKEGLEGDYGANIGSVLLMMEGDNIRVRAKAMAAAGSDARMSGCSLPVIINSGSGNQGMTCSLPVIEYGKELKKSEEEIYRALCVSNLVALNQKRYIGSLSAYCGAVCAAAGAGAGITYLCGGNLEQIQNTVVNTIADAGGIVCDGAKPSCAAKIATSLQAAILSHKMAMRGLVFGSGEGLVMDCPKDTIKAVGYVGRAGMKQTDVEILNLMIGKIKIEDIEK